MLPIYVAATGQNAGKTTASVGLVHFLRSRGMRVGFIKPVGQRFEVVDGARVDEDAVLIRSVFGIDDPLPFMSPVAIPPGFTTDYVRNKDKYQHLSRDILTAFEEVSKDKDFMVLEGTGHAGVGSIFDLSNATVARLLGAKVLIVAEGGIGRAVDEIMLNAALFQKEGVEILGVIINKVLRDKFDKVKEVVTQSLFDKDLCPIAFLPYERELTFPHITQVARKLDAEYLCGQEFATDYIENIVIAGMEPQNVIPYLSNRSLVITPGDRADNVLVAVSTHLMSQSEGLSVSAILLTHGFLPHERILELLRRSNIPVLFTNQDTYSVASQVYSMRVKTQTNDTEKIELIKRIFDSHTRADCLLALGRGCATCGRRGLKQAGAAQ